MWRGGHTETATGMQASASKSAPHNGLRYSVMRSVESMRLAADRMAQFDWLADDRNPLPLVTDVDRPFKVKLANNNNYAWGVGSGVAAGEGGMPVLQGQQRVQLPSLPSPVRAGDHPSRRACPWGR